MLLLVFPMIAACAAVAGPGVSGDGRWLDPPVGEGLVAAQMPALQDVPIPIGFVVLRSKCKEYLTSGGARIVEHMYQGNATVEQTAGFYRQRLPYFFWKQVRQSTNPNGAGLSFIKKSDRLDIQVQRSWNVTTVMISIHERETVHTAP